MSYIQCNPNFKKTSLQHNSKICNQNKEGSLKTMWSKFSPNLNLSKNKTKINLCRGEKLSLQNLQPEQTAITNLAKNESS